MVLPAVGADRGDLLGIPKSARAGLDLPEPGKRRLPEGDDVIRGESLELAGEDLPRAHPDEVGRYGCFTVLSEDAPDRVDEVATLPGEERQILAARLAVEAEQSKEVLRKTAGERRFRPAS